MRKIKIAIMALAAACGMTAAAQETSGGRATLFEYPTIPDSCSTLESRCNFYVTHFWDNYDISRPIADETAFEGAFRDWVSIFTQANRTAVMSSVRSFMFKAGSNTSNLLKVGRVAERSLYGPQAEFWSDEVYVEFAKSMTGNKQLQRQDREYYKNQIERINRTAAGSLMDFDFTQADGSKRSLSDVKGKVVLVLFSGDDVDSSIDRVRLSTSPILNSLIGSGDIAVVHIQAVKPDGEWRHAAESFPEQWVNGASEEALREYDVRQVPTCYLLDEEHKVMQKNVTAGDVLEALN